MQPTQAEEGCPIPKGTPRGSQEALFKLALLTKHRETALKGCHDEVGNLGLKNVGLDVQPFLLALNGCQGAGACQKMPPVHHLQGKTTEGSYGEYCGNPSSGAGPHWLPVSWAGERERRESPGSNWPFYPVCTGVCHLIPDWPNNSQSIVGLPYHSLWVAQEDSLWPGKEFWEWLNC